MSKVKRVLSDILAEAGKVVEGFGPDGNEARDRILALHVWRMATQGKLTFPDGRTIEASPRDWKDVTSFIFNHLDGPVRKEIDLDVTSKDHVTNMTNEQLMSLVQDAMVESDELVPEDSDLSIENIIG